MTSSLRRLCLLLALAVLCGCASTGGGQTLTFPRILGGSTESPDDPWKVPPTAYPTQRLFQAQYIGPDGKKVGFKLTLYLKEEKVFHMRAADGLGRKVWDLSVDKDDRALWLDHRGKEYCEANGASRLSIVPLARMPLMSLPKLLLGRLPTPPATDLLRSENALEYRDARARLWTGSLAPNGAVVYWTRVQDGEVVTWWRREGEESLFVDQQSDQQLRWREIVAEPMAKSPPPLSIPARYGEGVCVGDGGQA